MINAVTVTDGGNSVVVDGNFTLAVGSGFNNTVYDIIFFGNDIIAGGQFTTAGGTSASYIAKLDLTSTNLSALGSGVNGNVVSIRKNANNIFVDGAGLNSGIYFYTLQSGDFTETKKMILSK